MPEVNEDVWIKDNSVKWYNEDLHHTFKEVNWNKHDEKIIFSLTRRNLNKIDDPLLICANDGYDSFSLPFEGSEYAAKKMVEKTIKHFDKEHNVNINSLQNFFRVNIHQQMLSDSADGFINHFLNSSPEINKSSLEKINNHIENNSTIEPNGALKVKGFVELARDLNKGKPYPGDIMAFALRNDRLPTDEEIAKFPKQGETPPLERRNFNNKENSMSDEFEEEEGKNLSPKELAFINIVHQRKVIAEAIKSGTLSCLPGADGYADTKPAVNLVNDTYYHGTNILYLKEHQKQNGFPTAEYATYQQIENAKEFLREKNDNPDLFIRQGQKGVSLHVSEKIEGTDNWEEKHIRLFNVAQLNKPWAFKEWVDQKHQEEEQKKQEYLKTQYGEGYKPSEPKQKEPGPEIVCNSTEPEKYLGQYFAAVSMGSKFKVSPEQAAEFSEKMVNTMYEKLMNKNGEPVIGKEGQHVSNPFKLEEISRDANKFCKEFMRDLRIESQKQNQLEQKQEQTQQRSGFKM